MRTVEILDQTIRLRDQYLKIIFHYGIQAKSVILGFFPDEGKLLANRREIKELIIELNDDNTCHYVSKNGQYKVWEKLFDEKENNFKEGRALSEKFIVKIKR